VHRIALAGRPSWLPNSHILALVLGTAVIAGFVAYVARRDYQTTLTLWKSELATDVGYRTWALRNSLQQSQDDAHVLAAFASARALLLVKAGRSAQSIPRAILQEQVSSLFGEYRKIYEYGALYLLDEEGRVVVQEADAASSNSMLRSPKFQEVFGSAIRSRHYAVALVRGVEQELALIFMMPVLAPGTTDGAGGTPDSPIGVVALVDPLARDLLPLLNARSVGTRTGETMLLQLEAGGYRYASPRPYADGSADRRLRSDTLWQAASSAVDDHAVFARFTDYRGNDVMAALQKIPSINSVVVCKVDSKEVLADFQRVVRIETMAAASILLAYVGMILMHSRQAIARETREGLMRQQVLNQTLETTVVERTGQLAQTNRQLHQELVERQRAEEEVRTLNTELDQRVHERTIELEAANKELEAFSYSISHDLRAPLRRIVGFVTILVEDYASELPEKAQQFLQRVSKNAVEMGELIDCLLAFSRLGRQPVHKQEVAPGQIVREAWQDLCTERGGRRVEIAIGELRHCQADPILLKQVFINFLSNALKYSRTREITRIEVGMDGGAYFVRDNGVGFDMSYGGKLFGVFQRLHRAEDYEGTGVGLALVQRIIQRHGGRVWAHAVENQGATFYFTLGPGVLADADRVPV